jgi:BRCT domain type II-containing protein
MAQEMGLYAQDKPDSRTRYLVASRSDTSKAEKATALGIQVIDYDTFDQLHTEATRDGARTTPPPMPPAPAPTADDGIDWDMRDAAIF